MVSTVVRSARVADLVRDQLKMGGRALEAYYVGTESNPSHLDSYYIGDESNGVMIFCKPINESQRICGVSYCRYAPPALLIQMRLEMT